MQTNLINLGCRITKHREQLQFTQKELAEFASLSVKTIRAIENGKEGVAIYNWMLVADILGLELVLNSKKMNDETRKSI